MTAAFKQMVGQDIERQLRVMAETICLGMRVRLVAHDHIDTGALLDSIRHEEAREGDRVVTYVFADATNPRNGAQYAEFLEMGTGAAHGREGGRVGSWRYQDRNGAWRTTDGMDADPFIAPSVEAALPQLDDIVTRVVYDIEKYWRLKGGTP